MFEPAAFESATERSIREAIERGDFDDLPGKGKPIPGAGRRDDPLWWARSLLERQREIDRLEEARNTMERRLGAIWLLETEADVRTAVGELNRSLPSGLEQLDLDATASTWRAMAAARRQSREPLPRPVRPA